MFSERSWSGYWRRGGARRFAGNGTGRKVALLYAALLAFNVGAWVWASVVFRHVPLLLGTALLAYSLGLRHAVDADHIAAIDNVTRKLMQAGERPVTVGWMFSLGHSTVVVVGSMVLAFTAHALQGRLQTMRAVGNVVGTLVSAGFLFAIALVNVQVLRSVLRTFRRVRRGGAYAEEDLDLLLSGSGLLARVLRPAFRLVGKSWHMYPLGVLFGLGFDTATEVGLLGVSASEASRGLRLGAVMVFPLLFAAGMSLVDSADNILMLGAYGWALRQPLRKLYYNLTITSISVLVAVLVGGVEALGLVGIQLRLHGVFWSSIATLNSHFGLLGYAVVALFAVCWMVSLAMYRWLRLGDTMRS